MVGKTGGAAVAAARRGQARGAKKRRVEPAPTRGDGDAFSAGSSSASEQEDSIDSLPSSPEAHGGQGVAGAEAASSPGHEGDGEGIGQETDDDDDDDLAEFDDSEGNGLSDPEDSLDLMNDEFDGEAEAGPKGGAGAAQQAPQHDIPSGSGLESSSGEDSARSGEQGGLNDVDDSEGEDGSAGGGSGDANDDPTSADASTAPKAGGKGASFARAFAKILQRPVRGLDGSRGPQAGVTTAPGGTTDGVAPPAVLIRGAVGDAAILAESATHLKRQVEEEAQRVASRAAKRARLEGRKRGHQAVPKRGQDPAHDQKEKALQRLATRGVVMLFNAVTKAQRAQQEAAAAGSKAPSKAARATFLEQVRGGSAAAAPLGGLPTLGAVAVAGRPLGGVLGLLPSKQAAAAGPVAPKASAPEAGGAGWAVLHDGFTGLEGRGKMKDWDRKLEGEREVDGAAAASDSDGGDDDGW